MANITHYEVYAQKSGNWRLQERFPADQRDRAFDLAKKIEKRKVPVKIIRESFNIEDSRYMESVEYVNGLKNSENAKNQAKNKKSEQVYVTRTVGNNSAKSKTKAKAAKSGSVTGAVTTLIAIILFCLVFANLFVTLLSSVIEEFLPAQYYEIILSTLFFVLFLATATPLVVTKVPWHVFDSTGEVAERADERRIYSTAETVVSLYKLNDDIEPSISPVGEIPVEYKRYIINFLTQLIDDLGESVKINDSYRKMGMRLIVFGGCLGVSRYVNLSLAQANAMLYEAFKIIDGDEADVEAFYEAKRAYNDNKLAMYLTGVGAFIIDKMLKGKSINSTVVVKALDRWIKQEEKRNVSSRSAKPKPVAAASKQSFECAVNLRISIEKKDKSDETGDDEIIRLPKIAERLVQRITNEMHGKEVSLLDDVFSVKFLSLRDAIDFAVDFYQKLSKEMEEINDENLNIKTGCNILRYKELFRENLQDFLSDLFGMTYDEEVLVEKEVKDKFEGSDYDFEFLGEKLLTKSGQFISLYKLIF